MRTASRNLNFLRFHTARCEPRILTPMAEKSTFLANSSFLMSSDESRRDETSDNEQFINFQGKISRFRARKLKIGAGLIVPLIVNRHHRRAFRATLVRTLAVTAAGHPLTSLFDSKPTPSVRRAGFRRVSRPCILRTEATRQAGKLGLVVLRSVVAQDESQNGYGQNGPLNANMNS